MSHNWLHTPDCKVSGVYADGVESSQSIPGPKSTPQEGAQQHLTSSSAPAHPKSPPSQTAARQINQHQAPLLAAAPVILGLDPQGTDLHTATSAADASHDADGHALPLTSVMLLNISSSGDAHIDTEAAGSSTMPFTAAHSEQSHHEPAPQPASRPTFALGLSPTLVEGEANPQQAVLQDSPAVQTRQIPPCALGTGSQKGAASAIPSAGTSTSSSFGTAGRRPGSGVAHADWNSCADAPEANVSSSSKDAVQSTCDALTSSAVQSSSPAVASADSSARVLADSHSSVASGDEDTRPAVGNVLGNPVGLTLPEVGAVQAETGDRMLEKMLPRRLSSAAASAARADVYAVSDALLLDKLSDVCSSSTGVQSPSQTSPMGAASSKGSAQASWTSSQVCSWFHVFYHDVIWSRVILICSPYLVRSQVAR